MAWEWETIAGDDPIVDRALNEALSLHLGLVDLP
jgi:hypothetical protein